MASLHRVSCSELGPFRAPWRALGTRPASCLAPTVLRRALCQVCAFLDRNRGCSHDDIAVADGWVPVKGHFLPAALGSHGSPVVLVLPGCPQCELLGRFQEADAGVRGPHGQAALDKRHCGLARGELLFAVLNRNVLRHLCCESPVAGRPDDCPPNSRLTPSQSQSSTEKLSEAQELPAIGLNRLICVDSVPLGWAKRV